MTKVNIPTAFRMHVDGQRQIESNEKTIGALLKELTRKHPALREHLLDGDELLSFVNVFVNDENIRDLSGNETKLDERDEVYIVPAMAGG